MEILELIQILSDPAQGTNILYRIEKGLVDEIDVKRYFKYKDETLSKVLFREIVQYSHDDPSIVCSFEEMNGMYKIQLKMNVQHLHGHAGQISVLVI